MKKSRRPLSKYKEGNCIKCHTELSLSLAHRRGEFEIECPDCSTYFSIDELEKFMKKLSNITEGDCPNCDSTLVFDTKDRLTEEKIKCPECEESFYLDEVEDPIKQETKDHSLQNKFKSLIESQNRESIEQIIHILFQIEPNLKAHMFEGNEIFFREDELGLLNRYFPFLFDKTLKDDCDFETNQKILLIPIFLFYAKNKELRIDFAYKYATLLKGFILTEHPIFLYELTKLAWGSISKKDLEVHNLFINTGEFFIKYCKDYIKPENFTNQFEASLEKDFNYKQETAISETKKLLKESGLVY